MNKKPLIVVSILAVVLVVLSSMNTVVGYQIVKTSKIHNIKESYLTQKSNFKKFISGIVNSLLHPTKDIITNIYYLTVILLCLIICGAFFPILLVSSTTMVFISLILNIVSAIEDATGEIYRVLDTFIMVVGLTSIALSIVSFLVIVIVTYVASIMLGGDVSPYTSINHRLGHSILQYKLKYLK